MPEAAIDEYRYATLTEDKVRPSDNARLPTPAPKPGIRQN